MQRAAVLVQRKRLRHIVFLWHSAVHRKHRDGRMMLAMSCKGDRNTQLMKFFLWHNFTSKTALLMERQEARQKLSKFTASVLVYIYSNFALVN